MADYVESVDLGVGAFTSLTSAAVTGGQLVRVTGSGTVGPAVATSVDVVGVAAFDAASGARVTVKPIRMLHRTTAGTGGVVAGNPLKSDASGNVTLYVVGTDAVTAYLGTALETATAGNPVKWLGQK